MKSEAKRLHIVGKSGRASAPGEEPYRSQAERRAEGKTLRDAVPRADHSGWNPPKERRDPVEMVLASNEGRLQDLVPIRHGRMMQSPFAFYRGTAAIMAADLAHTPSSGLRVQACGDAHLANFGGFATPERGLIFDVNDLDETLPAPWEWDVKRLAASVVLAGRHIQLKQKRVGARRTRRRALIPGTHGGVRLHEGAGRLVRQDRRQPLVEFVVTDEKERARIQKRIEQARGRSVAEHDFPKLAEHVGSTPRIKDNPPLIFHSAETIRRTWKRGDVKAAWALYRESLPEHVRVLFDRFHLCDMAVKVVGVGSVGTACLIALFMAADDDPLFLQIKEANASVLEPYAGKSLHEQSRSARRRRPATDAVGERHASWDGRRDSEDATSTCASSAT